jgi:hypothetical protein
MDKPVVTIDDAPRCPKCDYVLLGLTEFRCPECGTPFDPEYVEGASLRVHLLPWERPETGGRVKRLTRTLVQASLHPGRFFTSANERKERRVRHAAKLIAAYILAALCFNVAAFLVNHTAFFVRLLVRQGQPSQALDTVLRSTNITWVMELQVSLMPMLSVLLSIVVMAALISRIFRDRIGSLRALDIAAFLGSAVAFGAFILAFAQAVYAVTSRSSTVVAYAAVPGNMAIVLVLVWYTSRRLLSLGCWKAVSMLVLGGFIEFGCFSSVFWLLQRLSLLISHGLP